MQLAPFWRPVKTFWCPFETFWWPIRMLVWAPILTFLPLLRASAGISKRNTNSIKSAVAKAYLSRPFMETNNPIIICVTWLYILKISLSWHSSHSLQAADTSDQPACLGLLLLLHLRPRTTPLISANLVLIIIVPPLPDPHNIHRFVNERKRSQLWGKAAQASFQGEVTFSLTHSHRVGKWLKIWEDTPNFGNIFLL